MTSKEIEELAGHRQVPAWVVKLVGDAVAAQKKEWVGLTLEEIKDILDCGRGGLVDIKKAEQKLKEKNHG
jgi:hypothetical protein